jgi:transcriptional regulator with XRE-family HTH domain
MGTRIRKLRESRAMTQAALATKAKISREYVNKLESGRYDPTMGVLQRIARALGVSLPNLLR